MSDHMSFLSLFEVQEYRPHPMHAEYRQFALLYKYLQHANTLTTYGNE